MELSNEIKKDLCQQYSVNENHRQTILISFLSILIASATGYGISLSEFIKDPKQQTLYIFFIPIIISIINGYALRRDQLIVDKIRESAFTECNSKLKYDDLFKPYNPKEKKCLCFLQDFNLAVIRISIVFQLIFLVTTIFIILSNCFEKKLYCEKYYCCCIILLLCVSFFILLAELIVFVRYAIKFSDVKEKIL